MALTSGTGNGAGTFGCPRTATARAGLQARNLDLGLEAEGGIHEADFKIVAKIRATLSRGTSAAAGSKDVPKPKKIAKDISEFREN